MFKWPTRKSDPAPVAQVDPTPVVQAPPEKLKTIVPKGWFVFEAGQSPVHMLWFVNLINFEDLMKQDGSQPRRYFAEEFDSFDEALTEVVRMMEEGEKNR